MVPFEAEDKFKQLGINIRVLQPGQPNCHYHAEGDQEDFLVLSGHCKAIVEGEEHEMKQWDFLHCPAGTRHVFVGDGRAPCAILMVGSRTAPKELIYPVDPVARKYNATADKETSTRDESYKDCPKWERTSAKWPLS
jgi:uncharacterized cupin superfamily protein